ncbi:MAG: GntR family transcriptional regulator [Acidimicrobiaceae bacterium]|nr:GntR family transcriptional regulator [Acidimicrobiaceae bacterium]
MGAGELLPSESTLSRTYEASRITVRKALELLRKDGIVESRQGFGWFVVFKPVEQSLGRFSTIEDQLGEIGVVPRRQILNSKKVKAEGRILEVLGGGEILEVTRLNLADGVPFARVTVWIPAFLADTFSIRDFEERSFYQLLSESDSLRRPLSHATQTIAAVAMPEVDAKLLGVPAGSPALECERITFDDSDYPILLSASIFPGNKTLFVTELTSQVGSIAPTGLRLVE